LQRGETRLPVRVNDAVTGTNAERKAFSSVTLADRIMIFSEILTTHQALTLQNLTNCIFASKK